MESNLSSKQFVHQNDSPCRLWRAALRLVPTVTVASSPLIKWVSWPNHYIIVHRVQLAMLYIQLCIAFYNNIVYCKFVMISNKFFNRSMLYRLNCVVWMGMQHSHTVNFSGLGEMALTSKHCIHQRLIVKSSETLGQGDIEVRG